MSATYECADQESMGAAIDHAARVMADGECIVLPTDTVYGIGCDAFSPVGVQTLLGAKGRTRRMPPPVLIANPGVMAGLADQVSDAARALADAFWPGALTLVCWAQPTLGWDLGETHGTVALRVPDDHVARQLLERVGPMAVSSANLTGMPAALTPRDAKEMLQDRVALYLDDGARPTAEHEAGNPSGLPSTIVDCTGEVPVVLRLGVIGLDELRAVVPRVDAGDNVPSNQAGDRSRRHNDGGGRSTRRSTVEALVDPGATEAETVRALVRNAAAGPGARVDQNRHRTTASQSGRGGTEALSVAEASQLVNGG